MGSRYRGPMPDPDESTASTSDSGDALAAPGAESDETPAIKTPFDHPWFLPVALYAAALWFGYDGWLNADFDQKWLGFNRYGFVVLFGAAVYYSLDTLRPHRMLRPALFAGYAAWLGYVGWLGGEDSTFAVDALAGPVSRGGTIASLALSVWFGVRALLASR